MSIDFSEDRFNAFVGNVQESTVEETNDKIDNNSSSEVPDDDNGREEVVSEETDEGTGTEDGSPESGEEGREEETEEKPKEGRANRRIRELNERAKAAEYRAKQLESELSVIRGESSESVKIDPNNYNTFEEYISAVTEAKANSLIVKKEEERLIRQRDAALSEYRDTVLSNFTDNVAQYAKVQPRIEEAVNHIEQYVDRIPPAVSEALLTDENAPAVMWEIANNVDLLTQIIKGSPIESIRTIAKLSARLETPKTSKAKSSAIEAMDTGRGEERTEKPGTDHAVPKLPTVRSQKSRGFESMSTSEIARRTFKERPW